MRLALFASSEVGLQIASFLAEVGEPPACLVLDLADRESYNDRIAAALTLPPDRVFTHEELRGPEGLERFRRLDVELGVLAWWQRIIKSPLIDIPRFGILNFHPSLLPHNRGSHSNFWALAEGRPYGVTIHFIDSGVDTGDIAFQKRLPVTWEDTGKTLSQKARQGLVELFKENFPAIKAGRITRVPQRLEAGNTHRSAELLPMAQLHLDRSSTAREILNLLRAKAFEPYAGCWFAEDDRFFEVQVRIRQLEGPPTT